MPPEMTRVGIDLSHPDYLGKESGERYALPDVAQLRDASAVLVMKKGVALSGRVLDSDGKPVAGAQVAYGFERGSSYPKTKTADDGSFTFKQTTGGEMQLLVSANGLAPTLERVAAGKEPVEIRLSPARPIRGRVVNSAGKAVEGASVVVSGWRGQRMLSFWSARTDADGRFAFDGPDDDVLFDVFKQGFMSRRNVLIKGSDDAQEHTIKLPAVMRVRGAVTDANTGKPIEAFRVVPGFGASHPIWNTRGGRPFTGGAYEMTFDEPHDANVIRIEADGYAPVASEPLFTEGDTPITFDAKLTKATGIAGVVRTPDGKPAQGATVLLATPGSQVMTENGRKSDSQNFSPETRTADDGRFALPPQGEPYVLVVLHDGGCAEVPRAAFEKSPEITLQPWGRLEGTVRIGSGVGAGESIMITVPDDFDGGADRVRIFRQFRGKTDGNGRFVFDRVRPGAIQVGRQIALTEMSYTATDPRNVTIEAGKTTTVELGGTGRPVVGRVAIPADAPEGLVLGGGRAMTKTPQVAPPFPADWKDMTGDARKKWYADWSASDAGKAFVAARERESNGRRSVAFAVQKDGTFRIDDVPAGLYELTADAHMPAAGNQCGPGDTIGTATLAFTVPDMPGGRSDEPLDVGTAELKLRAPALKVGDVAPPFAVKTVDGKDVSLADFKGKVVLVDFWATWCGPCVAETPNMKAVFDAFGKDARFAMIGLSLDEKADAPRDYAKKNGLGWTQGFLGEWSKTDVPAKYGVNGIPDIFLIGPDGKILAKGLRGPGAKAAVAKALAELP